MNEVRYEGVVVLRENLETPDDETATATVVVVVLVLDLAGKIVFNRYRTILVIPICSVYFNFLLMCHFKFVN